MTVERLAHVENARSPLRYDMAVAMCAAIQINPIWLATGSRSHSLLIFELPDPESAGISPRSLFSEAFDGFLIRHWNLEIDDLRSDWPGLADNSLGSKAAKSWLAQRVDAWISATPNIRLNDYILELDEFALELARRYWTALNDHLDRGGSLRYDRATQTARLSNPPAPANPPAGEAKKTILTYSAIDIQLESYAKTHHVKMQKQTLAQRIKNARKKLGLSQRQAAEKWGFQVQTIQQWEHGRRRPRSLYREKLEEILAGAELQGSAASGEA